MLNWLKNRLKPPMKEYVFPIIHPQGGKFSDHRIWAVDERSARLAVMACYDTGAFIIGPARQAT